VRPVTDRGRRVPIALLTLLSLVSTSCAKSEPPSILLFVADTLRADAVSAYGSVAGTTPEIDALAAAGRLYAQSHANAPWTLPSHVTLFTGLLPRQHHVDWGRPYAPDSLVTIAEMLRDAGYQTAGFSENPWVGDAFGLTQGFETFVDLANTPTREKLVDAVATWLRDRSDGRPFLVFVNVMDAHWPYSVRDVNPFLPVDVSVEEARALPQWPPDYICPKGPVDRAWEIQRGLYLGDAAAADAKLGLVRRLLEPAAGSAHLVTVVTADHGEHLGEHGLANHQFSVREPLLRVPLVVHGLPGAAPGRIEVPVQLADLVPSILQWTGLGPRPGLAGRPLPEPGRRAEPRLLRADYRDPDSNPDSSEPEIAHMVRAQARVLRSHCGPEDRVWGDLHAIFVHPFKLIAYAGFPAELYDLGEDPGEQDDIAALHPKLARLLATAVSDEDAYGRIVAELTAEGYPESGP